jgi:hypothetical protein
MTSEGEIEGGTIFRGELYVEKEEKNVRGRKKNGITERIYAE